MLSTVYRCSEQRFWFTSRYMWKWFCKLANVQTIVLSFRRDWSVWKKYVLKIGTENSNPKESRYDSLAERVLLEWLKITLSAGRGESFHEVLSVPKETGYLSFVPLPSVKYLNVIGSTIQKSANESFQIVQRMGSLKIVKF